MHDGYLMTVREEGAQERSKEKVLTVCLEKLTTLCYLRLNFRHV